MEPTGVGEKGAKVGSSGEGPAPTLPFIEKGGEPVTLGAVGVLATRPFPRLEWEWAQVALPLRGLSLQSHWAVVSPQRPCLVPVHWLSGPFSQWWDRPYFMHSLNSFLL